MAVQTDSGRRRHVLSALVQNQPGVLAHVSGMFASRGFNIDSLAVGETEDPHLSRITFVVHGRRPAPRAGPQAAREDRHGRQGPRHLQRGLRRARPDADQGRRAARERGRDPGAWSRSSAAGSWTSAPTVDDRDLRPGEEDRGVHRAGPALRHPRAGPHRPDRPGPRRPAARGRPSPTRRADRRRTSRARPIAGPLRACEPAARGRASGRARTSRCTTSFVGSDRPADDLARTSHRTRTDLLETRNRRCRPRCITTRTPT